MFSMSFIDLPLEVLNLDTESANVYSDLLKEESTPNNEIRTMMAGESNTGKTTLARQLVEKEPTKFRQSTDGIELYKGLSYADEETEEWLSGKLSK